MTPLPALTPAATPAGGVDDAVLRAWVDAQMNYLDGRPVGAMPFGAMLAEEQVRALARVLAALDHVTAERDAAVADVARLDWLESEGGLLWCAADRRAWMVRPAGDPQRPAWDTPGTVWGHERGLFGLRAALDAARSAP